MSSINLKNKSATHIVAATMGVLVGLAGVEHGFFEILQGNLRPDGILIQAIGSAQRYWEHGTETALTILPSYLMSGILSVLLGIIVILWSILFIDRRHGPGILLLLCILLFLAGGGFAPIFMAVLASLAATQIGKPMKFWRRLLPERLLRLLARIWLVSLIALVLLFLISVEIAIFGWPLTVLLDGASSLHLLYEISYGMIGLMLLSIVSGFAFDIQQQSGTRYGRHIQSQVQG